MKISVPVRSLILWFAFILIAAGGMIYAGVISGEYDNLRIWKIQDLLILFAALPFLFLQQKAGFSPFEGNSDTTAGIWILPVGIGIVFGLLDLLIFRFILHPEPYTSLPPYLQPFPYSIFLFLSGAFEIEIFYRMIPLTIICLAGKYYKKGQYYNWFFWGAALLTSLREPLEQIPAGAPWLLIYSFGTGFAMNLLQAYWYRKNGFIASLSLRLGHYLIWHILLGMWVEFFEIG